MVSGRLPITTNRKGIMIMNSSNELIRLAKTLLSTSISRGI